jgi:Kef-type K+ transport system membrane component KefB
MAVEAIGHALLTGDAVFMAAIGALALGAFLGGWIASWIAGNRLFAWGVAAILMLLSIVNIASFPHPLWFAPAAAAAIVLGAWLAGRLVSERRVAHD